MAEEGLEKTANDLIYIGHPRDFDSDVFLGRIEELMECAYSNSDNIRELVMELAPTYHPSERANAAKK